MSLLQNANSSDDRMIEEKDLRGSNCEITDGTIVQQPARTLKTLPFRYDLSVSLRPRGIARICSLLDKATMPLLDQKPS
jgi:hypothetical protein